jgi:DNA repair protein RadC
MNTRFPINCWAPDDRPREKLVKYGHKSLTNSELLAILIAQAHPVNLRLCSPSAC